MSKALNGGIMPDGTFIVFEGPEGAGKTTQIARLAAQFRARGLEPVLTREPGGTGAADAIRRVILDPGLTVNPLTEFLLYSASRAQHVDEVIRPALEQAKFVVSDRFFGASVAYQGYGRGLELGFIYSLTEHVTGGLQPDLVLLLDLDPEVGLERIAARGQKDRLELADLAFHRRVRAGFLKQAEEDSSWVVFDAAQGEEALAHEIWTTVESLLKPVE
ncbi:dTMP kinase [soil metagenome]